tara:strand:- start:150 stop:359 length:210 start_codon:yes stop_codon:yes gene_type:complete
MKRDDSLPSEDGFYRIILETLYDEFAELWNMWFGLADSTTIVGKLREINHKFNLGLVEVVEYEDPRGEE